MLFSLNTIIQRHNIATLAITTKDGGFSNKERRLVWMGVDNAPFPRYSNSSQNSSKKSTFFG